MKQNPKTQGAIHTEGIWISTISPALAVRFSQHWAIVLHYVLAHKWEKISSF